MTNKTTTELDEQLHFFFWLGADGEVESVSEEEFKMKQEQWNGQRPNRND
jgi:hypothetical protein